MPDATITSTASTFGTITGTFAADQSTVTGTITGVVAGTLTGSVGVPGPQGPTGATGATGATGPQGNPGAPGQGVPVGGSAGQFLTKIDGTNYNTDWTTVNLSVYAVKANNLSDLADAPTARTNLGLGTMATATAADYSTTTVADGLYYPLSGNPSGFLTSVPPPTLTNLTSDISWDGSANTGRLLIAGVNDIGGGNTEARLNFTSGVPTQPATGDFWTNGTDFFYRESGSTKTIASQSYVSANYQPLSGMSSYLTTASAASTYFTIASAASKANLASPTFTGTPAAPTAAADTNTTQLATTAFVVGQAGSSTPLVNGTAAVGTSLRYARQDHVHGTDTTRAPLASPALTGTPTAPTATAGTSTTQIATTAFVTTADNLKANLASPALTGTPTAPTATAGTNTTQIATTAFVTAAVPALATLTDSRQLTNDTKAMSPFDVRWSLMTQDYIDIDRLNFTYTTTGTPQWNQVGSITTNSRLNATVASSVIGRPFGTSQVDQVSPFLFRNNWNSNINFNLKTHLSGRAGSFSLLTDAAFNQAFYYGKVEGDAIGDLVRRGFGWRWTGGAGSRFVNLVVHNGTTQTTVASSFAVTQEVAFDWDLYSDGAGNVTLYINGSQVATSSAGPTSYQSAGTYAWWREEAWTTAAPSFGNHTSYFRGGRAAILNY